MKSKAGALEAEMHAVYFDTQDLLNHLRTVDDTAAKDC
jgi:hypothetical protein